MSLVSGTLALTRGVLGGWPPTWPNVALDRKAGEARGPLNQLKLAGRGTSWNAAVHLQGSKQFDIVAHNVFRVEGSQMIILRHYANGSTLKRIVAGQGNERSHVANLTIESGTALMQDFRNGHVRGNGVKYLRFRFQRRADSGFRSARQSGTLPPFAGGKMRFVRLPPHDVDFDGVPYHHAWAGTPPDAYGFSAVPSPIRFTSLKFRAAEGEEEGELRNFSRVAFEADIPAIEDSSVCDVLTGKGCTNPPPGAVFYPIYSTTSVSGPCWWQLGGPMIPGTTNNFGGSSTTEYSTLLGSIYQTGTSHKPGSVVAFENYHQILPHDPCE